jgi:chemotaxis protein CheD
MREIPTDDEFDESPERPATPLPGYEKIKRYWDPTRNMYAAKILPGEYYVTKESELITTVLGSCVSACIRDPKFGIGGMNHFMLPEHTGGDSDRWGGTHVDASARYGNVAMEQLITAIQRFGGSRGNLEVKITGGGRVLASMTDVGRRNIEFVLEYIRKEGLRLVGEEVGDIYPRKVVYYPQTGKVQIKKLRVMHNQTIIQREKSYLEEIARMPVDGGIELF